MNKLVLTMATGLYVGGPGPGPTAIADYLSDRITVVFAADSVPSRSHVVSINGGNYAGDSSGIQVRQPPPSSSCARTMTWSISKMVSTALTDDCVGAQNEQTRPGSVVAVSYPRGT